MENFAFASCKDIDPVMQVVGQLLPKLEPAVSVELIKRRMSIMRILATRTGKSVPYFIVLRWQPLGLGGEKRHMS